MKQKKYYENIPKRPKVSGLSADHIGMSYEKALAHRIICIDFGLTDKFNKNEAYMARKWPNSYKRWNATSDCWSPFYHDDEYDTVTMMVATMAKHLDDLLKAYLAEHPCTH